jgi:16S rRNA (guanine527-N7)-methyltransferase
LDIILKYFPNLSGHQIEQFKSLESLYKDWNSRINVISRKDMDQFYLHHVLHSLGIAKVKKIEHQQKILDVGTGGGFPGIPLAILFPEATFQLVDSIGKKIKVVNEVSYAIRLKNVVAEHKRAEEVKGAFDFVVSRAVTRLKPFVSWVDKKITKSSNRNESGILYLKGGDLEEELNEVPNPKEIYNLKDYFEEDFFETKKVVYIPS